MKPLAGSRGSAGGSGARNAERRTAAFTRAVCEAVTLLNLRPIQPHRLAALAEDFRRAIVLEATSAHPMPDFDLVPTSGFTPTEISARVDDAIAQRLQAAASKRLRPSS